MFPASTNGGGQCFAFPDTCKTPTPGGPVPIPYPNIAMVNQASGSSCAKKVKICGKKAVHKKTKISMSSGDEAGCAGGGVISSKMKGAVNYKMGVSKVKIEGNDAINHLKMSGHNGSNANAPPGTQVAPSQTTVILMG